MDAANFVVGKTTAKQVFEAIKKVPSAKNTDRSYSHDKTKIFLTRVERILVSQYYYAKDGTQGMSTLLSDTRNILTRVTPNTLHTPKIVLASLKRDAVASGVTDAVPEIATISNAQLRAKRLNIFVLAVLGTKEVATKGIKHSAGSNTTNPKLKNHRRL